MAELLGRVRPLGVVLVVVESDGELMLWQSHPGPWLSARDGFSCRRVGWPDSERTEA